ncbi:outer membrane lipoprotein-sorting protein [Marinoscillum sp. MHG1-6]|uniref:outer membrane lipoprotein-sorting protein n=1 Tax=Marinoscillum sp. MHG1-6 TaxID=2959627 RepID=UPI002157D7AB|nr:outer membrane lipoprotein-sorting protein [Marinoscillum sp. MHG1-6]
MKRILILSLFFIVGQLVFAQSASEIIERANQKMQGETNRAEMVMKIIRPDWSREIQMKSWTKGTEYSLVLITAPVRDQGSAFLKRETELWNWQPTINRVIKMPPSMMMQSWMGSDFTNDDLVKQSSIVEDYDHEMLGDTIIGMREAWKIELIPKPDAAVVWGRLEVYIDKKDYLELLIKYYDEDEYLINTMIMSDIREMGGRVIPTKMEVIPAENPDQRTVITYKDMEFDQPMDDSFFSLQNMKRVR